MCFLFAFGLFFFVGGGGFGGGGAGWLVGWFCLVCFGLLLLWACLFVFTVVGSNWKVELELTSGNVCSSLPCQWHGFQTGMLYLFLSQLH